jgi:hypothetical protein
MDSPSLPTYAIAAYVVRPTDYDKVTNPDKRRWCLTVADAGDGWAIRRRSMCLDYRDQWEFEPPADMRDAAFLRRCRFTERAALLRARQVVDRLTVRGETFADFQDRIREEAAEQARQYLELERRRDSLLQLTRRILVPASQPHRNGG